MTPSVRHLCLLALAPLGCSTSAPVTNSKPAASPSASSPQQAGTLRSAPDPLAQLEAAARSATGQHQEQVRNLLTQAKAALAKKDFAHAEKCLNDALALDSSNLAIGKAQRELNAAREATIQATIAQREAEKKARNEKETRNKAAYADLMRRGREALEADQFEEASRHFAAAAKLNPQDNDAPLLQGMADKYKVAAEKEAEAKRQEAQAEERRRAEEAENEKQRQLAEKEARQRAEAQLQQKLSQDKDAQRRAEQLRELTLKQVQNALTAGQSAFKAERFADAVKSFEKALQLSPGNEAATKLLRQAQFQLHLADASAALANSDQSAALKSIQAALKLFPDHPQAKKLLEQIKK